jgi:L-phenylalanine/L-methionine N-acetyltransferase
MTIIIRHTEPGDAEAFAKIFSGPKAIWGTLQIPYPSVEMWRKRLTEPPEGMYGLVACADEQVIGQLVLNTFPNRPRRRHVGSIGMAVCDDWQGKGVGTALMQAAIDLADKWLNLMRLELEVYVDNEPAIRLYKKFGFQIEGTGVKADFRDGEYVDIYMMARLRPPRA